MTNLYDRATRNQLKERIANLGPESRRQWGKMDAAQAMAHCSQAMEWAVGAARPPRMFIGRLIGGLVKSKVLAKSEPMRRNSPTAKTLVVADKRDLAAEQKRLCALIAQFCAAGPAGCT